MGYNKLCEIIDILAKDSWLISNIMSAYVKEDINNINKLEAYSIINKANCKKHKGIIYFDNEDNSLKIGKEKSPVWKQSFSNNIKESMELFDNIKHNIVSETEHIAKLFSDNINKVDDKINSFLQDVRKKEILIEFNKDGFFDFDNIRIIKNLSVNNNLVIECTYNNMSIGCFTINIFNELNDNDINEGFNLIYSRINSKFLKKVVEQIIKNVEIYGRMSRSTQKMLVNFAISQGDYRLGSLLATRRRCLYKTERERLDGFIMSGKLIGIIK